MESTKPYFKFEDYPEKEVAMHCKTTEEAEYFCKFLHGAGKTWSDGSSYLEYRNFEGYKENTVYYFNKGTYGDKTCAVKVNILEFSDFEWFGFIPFKQPVIQDNIQLFNSYIDEMLTYCRDLLIKKNESYNAGNDPIGNFKKAAKLQGVSNKQALIGMMDKHVVSIHDMVNRETCSEKFTGEVWKEKIGDNINYLLILYAMMKIGE
ncbi:MAG: hypothetical protein ACI4E1_07730 [Lachnospira sp.]